MSKYIRISELEENEEISGEDLMETSTLGPNDYESKKVSIAEIGNWGCNANVHEQLETQNKTIVGAINEIKNSNIPKHAAAHNAIFRGNYLGTAPTTEQYTSIEEGTFDDIFIGDYWAETPNSELKWVVAGLNYYYGTGSKDHEFYDNHIVIIPSIPLAQADMYIGLAYGGYAYSDMRGYKHATETFTLTDNEQLNIPLQHTPVWALVTSKDTTTIYDEKTQQQITVNIELSWTIKDFSNNQVEIDKSFTVVSYEGGKPFPVQYESRFLSSGTELTIEYKYFEEDYGGLAEARQIIEPIFGDHVIEHEFLISKMGMNSKLGRFETEAVISDMELPTVQMISGNNYLTNEIENSVLQEWLEPHFFNATNEGFVTDFSGCNRIDWNVNLSYEVYQLPLFNFDLRAQFGYYWFRNIHKADSPVIFNITPTIEGGGRSREGIIADTIDKTLEKDDYEVQYVQMAMCLIGSNESTGVRPVFCIGG